MLTSRLKLSQIEASLQSRLWVNRVGLTLFGHFQFASNIVHIAGPGHTDGVRADPHGVRCGLTGNNLRNFNNLRNVLSPDVVSAHRHSYDVCIVRPESK